MSSDGDFRHSPTLYLILTYSGKPIYYSRGAEEDIVRYTGVIQAINSCFDEQNELRWLESESTVFAVHSVYPLILVAIDRLRRSVAQLRSHLELLHAQILSVLTKQQLERQYTAKPSIDLRPMLGGTEAFLRALTSNLEASKPWSWLGALESLELRKSTRAKLNTALLESRPNTSLLYAIVVSDGKFCGVARPKQHSLHPPDLHLVFNMLFNTLVFREGEHWVPICFPRFNPNGFLYAYIRLITPPHTFLVLVSPDRHGFFEMQNVAKEVMHRLENSLVEALSVATSKGRIQCSRIGVEPIEYFVCKSRPHVQFIQSADLEDAVINDELNLQFAQLQASMTTKHQRICWYRWGEGGILGWHTPVFELYCYATSDDKETLSHAVKNLVAWIRKHENRLFIVDGGTF